jgi:sugar O-acyltransferase (sialic acid O-acetyltransferase NeuD family)
MNKLAIYGAGGHGRVVAETASMLNWHEIFFFDDIWPKKQKNSIWPVIGDYKILLDSLNQFDGIIVAIGNCIKRLEVTRELFALHAPIISLVHPRAFVSPITSLGDGTVVFAGAVINIETKVGEATIINTGATVDHDCVIGPGVHVCPGANLSGGVEIGEASWIGVGSCVREGIKIGANVMIGAGAVIVKNVPDRVIMLGELDPKKNS